MWLTPPPISRHAVLTTFFFFLKKKLRIELNGNSILVGPATILQQENISMCQRNRHEHDSCSSTPWYEETIHPIQINMDHKND
jgi:hypothetical protein